MTVVLVPNASVPPHPAPWTLADIVAASGSPTSIRDAAALRRAPPARPTRPGPRRPGPARAYSGDGPAPDPRPGPPARPRPPRARGSARSSSAADPRRPRRRTRALRHGPGDLLLQPPQLGGSARPARRAARPTAATPCSGPKEADMTRGRPEPADHLGRASGSRTGRRRRTSVETTRRVGRGPRRRLGDRDRGGGEDPPRRARAPAPRGRDRRTSRSGPACPVIPLAINGTSWLGFRRGVRVRVGEPTRRRAAAPTARPWRR